MKIDVHSRRDFRRSGLWLRVNRAVVSSDDLMDDYDYLRWLMDYTLVRVVHVVTEHTTDRIIKEYLMFQRLTGCQFTIKELVGHKDQGRYTEVVAEWPEIYRLDRGDYNIYYMPDNTVTETFLQ